MSINDGGPAFPEAIAISPAGDVHPGLGGMTLRDYFAAKAMQAQCMTDMVPGEANDALILAAKLNGQDPLQRLALNSYEIADAMIAARGAA